MFVFKKKFVIFFIVFLFLCFLSWGHLSNYKPSASYMTAPVQRGDMVSSIFATGIIKPHRMVAVGARVTGRIIMLNVNPGDKVKKGDLIAEIDSTTQKNTLKNTQAALAIYQARLLEQQARVSLAQKTFQRQQTMIQKNTISKAIFDDAREKLVSAQAQLDAIRAQITQAEIEVENARINLDYTRITAPFDGTILATIVQEGQNVNAVQSVPTIAILGDLSKMTVRIEVSEADIQNIAVGQPLYFNVIGNAERRYYGKLATIEPAPTSIRNDIAFNSVSGLSGVTSAGAIYYNAMFDIDNQDDSLRTYMTAEVHLITGEAKHALLIPASSLIPSEKSGVYLVQTLENNKEIVQKEVKIGLNNKITAEVLSGLSENDIVLTQASLSAPPSIGVGSTNPRIGHRY